MSRRGTYTALVAVCVALGLSACARRTTAYHFRAPVVAGVAVRHLPSPDRSARGLTAPDRAPRTGRTEQRALRTRAPHRARPSHLRVPAGRYTGAPVDQTLAGRLRSYVGKRDTASSDMQFAWHAIASLGLHVAKEIRSAKDGSQLLRRTAERNTKAAVDAPVLGDLIVFDRVGGKRNHTIVAVVVGISRNQTVEFVYLWRNVVRRGFMNRRVPSKKRGQNGRSLNTFVLGENGRGPPGTRYLAGELFARYVRLEWFAV